MGKSSNVESVQIQTGASTFEDVKNIWFKAGGQWSRVGNSWTVESDGGYLKYWAASDVIYVDNVFGSTGSLNWVIDFISGANKYEVKTKLEFSTLHLQSKGIFGNLFVFPGDVVSNSDEDVMFSVGYADHPLTDNTSGGSPSYSSSEGSISFFTVRDFNTGALLPDYFNVRLTNQETGETSTLDLDDGAHYSTDVKIGDHILGVTLTPDSIEDYSGNTSQIYSNASPDASRLSWLKGAAQIFTDTDATSGQRILVEFNV